MEQPDRKMPPLKDIPTVLVNSPPRSPFKPEGSITREVSNLLSQAVLEVSSCESQQSPSRRLTTAVVLMSLLQRPEGLLLPADTSSRPALLKGKPPWKICQPTSLQLLPFPKVTAPAFQCI